MLPIRELIYLYSLSLQRKIKDKKTEIVDDKNEQSNRRKQSDSYDKKTCENSIDIGNLCVQIRAMIRTRLSVCFY